MARTVSIRWSLLGNLLLVIVLLSGAILITTILGARQVVETLSLEIIGQTVAQTNAELRGFFNPIIEELTVARSWGEKGLLDTNKPESLNRLFVPVMQQHRQVSSLLLADARGHEYMLLHIGDRWKNRQSRRDEWRMRTRWLEWSDAEPQPTVSWKELDYDPRRRPWYRGAVEQANQALSDSRQLPIHWTKPYTFFTAKETGITVSMTFDPGDGLEHVVGFDILLSDISDFTMGLRVSDHGKVVVLTDDDYRVIGLPSDQRYQDLKARQAALLKRPEDLGLPLAVDAAQAFAGRAAGEDGPLRFTSNGQPWWGGVTPFNLGPDRTLLIVVLVPESDLLPSLKQLRLSIVLITLVVLAVALWRAFVLAARYSSPIEMLVEQSDRISRGNLYEGKPLLSSVTEVQRLTEAHERMRLGLQSLLKLERDLQLARQIQQNTFPRRLPAISGFEISAWSEPADATGGDTYDVIGYRRDSEKGSIRLSARRAQRAILLLADATGHGIGPALSATQTRAMLRIAVRMGGTFGEIAQHINDQLYADLHAGRFITAWLGELDESSNKLTTLSAGQAPILHYDAQGGRVNTFEADVPPFGVLADLNISIEAPLSLNPGDIVAVISDGVFEATNPRQEQFGTEPVIELLETHHEKTATKLLEILQDTLAAFTEGTPASDDRTALIIKRVSG